MCVSGGKLEGAESKLASGHVCKWREGGMMGGGGGWVGV